MSTAFSFTRKSAVAAQQPSESTIRPDEFGRKLSPGGKTKLAPFSLIKNTAKKPDHLTVELYVGGNRQMSDEALETLGSASARHD